MKCGDVSVSVKGGKASCNTDVNMHYFEKWNIPDIMNGNGNSSTHS